MSRDAQAIIDDSFSNLDLRGRSAIVTGGSGGIGSAICIRLLDHGANVMSVDLKPAPEDSIRFSTGQFIPVVADISEPEDVSELFQRATSLFRNIDIVVANAGKMYSSDIEDVGADEWDDAFRTNVRGTMLTCQAAATVLTRGGRLVVISSVAGLTSSSITGVAYSVSKAAIIHLTKVVAHQLRGKGINVNCVAPAAVDTPMSVQFGEQYRKEAAGRSVTGRIGVPEDVADAVVYLVSSLSVHVTGHVLEISGGSVEP